MRIGLIAPPWITVPPTAYGGTEVIVDNLARGLVARGHDVLLCTVGDSTCPVRRTSRFEHVATPMGTLLPEAVHVLDAYEQLYDVDIIHDHTLLGPLLSLGRVRPGTPVVVTNHGAITPLTEPVLREASRHAAMVAISHSQQSLAPQLPITAVIHHGIDLDQYAVGPGGGGFLLFLGRMSAEKGAHRAIRIARAAGRRLVMVSKMWEDGEHAYFDEMVRPLMGPDVELLLDSRPEERVYLLQHAEALLNPIQWHEPFGLAMAEALACGTPVIGSPYGAAPEIIDHGVTGFLADTDEGLASGARHLDLIDRQLCRKSAEERFSLPRMVRDHERLYISLLRGDSRMSWVQGRRYARPLHFEDFTRRTVGVDG
jgi:glycosyltransferase involved in cell wall biosynthesis